MSGRPEHTQEKLHDEIAAFVDIFLHGKKQLSPSNSVWDIKIYKVMQSDWSKAFLITTEELDFS